MQKCHILGENCHKFYEITPLTQMKRVVFLQTIQLIHANCPSDLIRYRINGQRKWPLKANGNMFLFSLN